MDVSQVSFAIQNRVGAAQPLESVTPFRSESQQYPRNQAREETREVAAAVQQLNQAVYSGPTRELTIRLDPETHRPTVRIVDKATGEVLQQIPNEYVLRLAQEAKERQKQSAA